MIRAAFCTALALTLTACGSSGPRRPSIPSDPSLVKLQGGMNAAQYADAHYGGTSAWQKRRAAAAPPGTGLSLRRMLLPRVGNDRVLRNIYALGVEAPQSTMADYHVVDVILEGAATPDGLPVYRVTLFPRAATIDELALPDVLAIPIMGTRFPVPLVDATPVGSGGLRTGWTWCGSCLDRIRGDLVRPVDFSDEAFSKAYNAIRYGVQNWRNFVQKSRQQGGYSTLPDVVIVDGVEEAFGKYSASPTLDVALAIADEYAGFDAALEAYESAKQGWVAYGAAFADAKAPSLNEQVDMTCELTEFGYRRGSIQTIREDQRWMANALREDVECASRVARDYDPGPYFASYEAWQRAEPELRERYGLSERQRRTLPDPATEVSRLNERMRKHQQAGKEKIEYGDRWIESMYRAGEAKRPGSSGVNYGAIVAGVANGFARDMQQTQRRNAAYAASLYGMVGSSQRSRTAPSGGGAQTTAVDAPVNVAVAPVQAARATGGADDDTEANARQEADEARRAEREAEAARRAAEREAKAAAARALKARLDAVQPRKGGPFGCVKVVDRIIRKGSSPHSSCAYSEPDRESSVIVFHNQCGFPVNAHLRFGVDTGGQRDSGEYNIKPGSRRQTVAHCGMTSYEYWYEETRESLMARRDEVRASVSGDN